VNAVDACIAQPKEFIVKRFISFVLGAASTLAISSSAFAAPEYLSERADASHALSRGFDRNEADEDARQANLASQRGDWAISVSFAERSYRENPSIRDEFNLATAYEHMGRGDLAVPLYIDLVDRGQYTQTVPIDNFYGLPQSPMLANLADEAASRLKRLGARTATAGPIGAFPLVVEK
jgi:hypothetical protein